MMKVIKVENLPFERWKEYEGYMISDYGRVYTFKSKFKNNRDHGRLLKPNKVDPPGYMKQCLNYKSHSIHRLVAILFVPNPKNLPEVHIDHNKENNHYKNLKWVTHQQNIQLSYGEGNHIAPRGSDHWNFGKKVKQATKQKQSLAKIGEKHPKFKGYYLWQGQRFTSCQALADHLGTYAVKVNRMVKKGLIQKSILNTN